MFDLSWSELLLVAVVAILVIGPKDLPVVARNLGRWIGKAKRAASDFMKLLEDAADDTGIKQAKEAVEWESSKVTRLIDLDGNERMAYDMDDVEKALGLDLRKKKKPAQKKKAAKKTAAKKRA